MLHWDLLTGPFPIGLMVVAGAAGVFLLARRGGRRWWVVVVPSVAAGSVGGALLITWYVNNVWQPFPDPLPGAVVLWIGMILAGIGLLVGTLVRAGWRRRVVAVVAALAVCACSLNEINQAFGYYPTLATALGQEPARQIALPGLQAGGGRAGPSAATDPVAGAGPGRSAVSASDPAVPGRGSGAGRGSPDRPAGLHRDQRHAAAGVQRWRPSGAMPRAGAISEVRIPGTVSGFRARAGWVYVPPAYLTAHRPDLPVLMLLPGQPGGPADWINGGHLVTAMDAFAARHHGLAPIVVLPDANGSATGNTMCVNSRLGRVDTYLSRDVIDWVLTHLQVDRDTAHWAVGGFSFGGTCALQLAVAHPGLFPTFLDISGQVAPTLGRTSRTVDMAFDGDRAAYEAVQPLRRLAADHKDPAMARVLRGMDATFAVGAGDHTYGPQEKIVARECRRVGMSVRSFTVPGGHNWYVPAAAFPKALPHLAARMGLS